MNMTGCFSDAWGRGAAWALVGATGTLLRDYRQLLRQCQSADAPASTAEFYDFRLRQLRSDISELQFL